MRRVHCVGQPHRTRLRHVHRWILHYRRQFWATSEGNIPPSGADLLQSSDELCPYTWGCPALARFLRWYLLS